MSTKDESFTLKLMATFKIEADEHLNNLTAGLLNLEKCVSSKPPQEEVQAIFREAHNLKGAARAVNHDAIQLLCQSMENVLAELKQEKIELSSQLFDTFYASIDLASSLLNPDQMATAKINLAEMVKRLDALLSNNAKKQSTPTYTASSQPEKAPLGVDPKNEAISQPSTMNVADKSHENAAHIPRNISSQPNQDTATAAVTSSMPARESQTVRVTSSKLDRLFQQAEELLTIKLNAAEQLNSLKKMGKLLQDWKKESMRLEIDIQNQQALSVKNENLLHQLFNKNHTFIQALSELLYPLDQSTSSDQRFFGAIIDNLLEDAKALLMQPFGSILESFPRMVRDVSHQLSKKVHLEIQGADIEIDRRILEEIKDPLIHCIRNSIDHGIGHPEERKAMNKPEEGTIQIVAAQLSANSIEIIIRDDGQGLNTQAIKQAAVKQKLLSQKEADRLSEQEAQKLIFYSGLSTSKIVTELSGRGLGMGIVVEKADKLGGQVSVESSRYGTTIRFVLPLTLATFRGIQLKIAHDNFIMPTQNVLRVVKRHKNEIKSVENRPMLAIDGQAYSYVHLGDILGLPKVQNESQEFITVLIVKAAEHTMAFGVDAVINEQEVLVKRFGQQLKHVKNILSATVIEMGKVVPILNPSDLVKTSMQDGHQSTTSQLQSEQPQHKAKRILLVEDSVTTRMLLKNILESAHFEVFVANNGQEAFNMLKEIPVDIVLTDIEMPHMDGFTLTENIRKNEALKDLPVILCTSLNSLADRERGVEVGAQAYIDKSSFTQSHLLDMIEKLL